MDLSASNIDLTNTLQQYEYCRTRFQLILPVDSQDVAKNLTGHRMHVAGPHIYQINRKNNSFQNVHGVLHVTIDRLARKIDFVPKTPHFRLFCLPASLGIDHFYYNVPFFADEHELPRSCFTFRVYASPISKCMKL